MEFVDFRFMGHQRPRYFFAIPYKLSSMTYWSIQNFGIAHMILFILYECNFSIECLKYLCIVKTSEDGSNGVLHHNKSQLANMVDKRAIKIQ